MTGRRVSERRATEPHMTERKMLNRGQIRPLKVGWMNLGWDNVSSRTSARTASLGQQNYFLFAKMLIFRLTFACGNV